MTLTHQFDNPAETAFGGKLGRRSFENQAAELFLRCAALNQMIQLYQPESYVVES